MHQAAFHDRTLVDLDALVMHVTFDPRPRLEFEALGRLHRSVDDAVHHDVRGLHFAVDARIGGNHQGAGLIGQRRDVAAHHPVHPQSAAEHDIALDARGGADQAVDAVLRLARLVEHDRSPLLRYSVTVWVARGWLEPFSYTLTCTLSTRAFGLTRKVPCTRRKYLKASLNSDAPASAGSGKLIIALWSPSVRVTTSSNLP